MAGDREDLDFRWPAVLRSALSRLLASLDVAPLEVASAQAAHLALGSLAHLVDRMPRRPCGPIAAFVCSEPRACGTSVIERLMLAPETRLPKGVGVWPAPGRVQQKRVASDMSVRRACFGHDKATALRRLRAVSDRSSVLPSAPCLWPTPRRIPSKAGPAAGIRRPQPHGQVERGTLVHIVSTRCRLTMRIAEI